MASAIFYLVRVSEGHLKINREPGRVHCDLAEDSLETMSLLLLGLKTLLPGGVKASVQSQYTEQGSGEGLGSNTLFGLIGVM